MTNGWTSVLRRSENVELLTVVVPARMVYLVIDRPMVAASIGRARVTKLHVTGKRGG